METENLYSQVIIIDDDPGNNMITKMILKKVLPHVAVISFTDPEVGVGYIENEYCKDPVPAILLLDINMPVLMGWDVLDILTDIPEPVKAALDIYVVSSSINPEDKKRANDIPLVKGYLEKPLTISIMKTLFAREPHFIA